MGANFLTDMENRLVTRDVNMTLLGVQLQSQENLDVRVIPTHERLEEDFEIHPGIVLLEGQQYNFTRYRLGLGIANQRILAAQSSFEFGSFFSGNREEAIVSLGVRPFVGMVANLSTEWNRIDFPEGEFQTRLYRLTLDNQFNPWIFVVNNKLVTIAERECIASNTLRQGSEISVVVEDPRPVSAGG